MPRLTLHLPESFQFTTDLPVRITDINYGGHLGNDAVLSLLHESRVRFLMEKGYTEFETEGSGLIMTDTAIIYKSEAFYGETLRIQMAVKDISTFGFDFYYLVRERESGRHVVHAKTGMAFFDYSKRELVKVPEAFIRNYSS